MHSLDLAPPLPPLDKPVISGLGSSPDDAPVPIGELTLILEHRVASVILQMALPELLSDDPNW